MIKLNIISDLDKEELQTIYNFITNFFIGLLKPVKESDLIYYIKKNAVFDLKPYFKKLPKQIRQKISIFARENKAMLKSILTPKNLISQAKKNRPDLYRILITRQGRDWLKRFMIYIQKLVLLI